MLTQLLPYLIVGAVILLFVAIFRIAKRQRAESKAMFQELGFSEITAPDPRLIEKIKSMREFGKSTARVSRVYQRRQGYFTFYVLEIWSGGDSDANDGWTSAILSDELRLPTFALGPSIPLKGKFGELLNKAVTWALERRGYTQAKLHPESAFSKRYLLYGKDPDSLLRTIPDSSWQRLAQLKERLMLEAADDLILFWVMSVDGQPMKRRRSFSREDLRNQIDCAQKLFELFRESALVSERR
jgi:hypothetical protein